MKKEITVNENKTEVMIELSLKRRIMARDPRMTVTTKMVKAMLENENFKLDKCILHDIINNNNENSKHDGKWIFSLIREKRVKVPVPKKNPSIEKTTKESIDNAPKVSKRRRRKKES